MTAWWHKQQRPVAGSSSGNQTVSPPLGSTTSGPMNLSRPSGGGGGGQSSYDNILQTLLGYTNNTPATPQMPMPQMPGGVTMPQLDPVGSVSRPGDLSAPNVGYGPQLSAPNLQPNAPLSMPGQLTMPTLDLPGSLNTPGALGPAPMLVNPTLQSFGNVESPQLRGGVGLDEISRNTMGYVPTDYNGLFGPAPSAPSPINVPQFGGGGGGGYPQQGGPMQVGGGIGPQWTPQAPQAAPAFGFEGMSPAMAGAVNSNYQAALGPMMNQLQGQHLQQGAQFGNQYQDARAQSGLGWGGLGQQQQQINAQGRLGQQGNVLGWLGGMI